MRNTKPGRIVLIILLVFIFLGSGLSLASPRNQVFERAENPALPFLTLYTTRLATGPQLALWQAIEQGRILEKCNIRVKLWNDLEGLRKTLYAGEGDLWVGHTDVFVDEALQDAPVQLLLTTGWRKFYLLSSDPDTLRFNDFIGKPLVVSPPGSPAVPVLKSLGKGELGGILFTFEAPKTILEKLIKKEIAAAIIPEPLVTKALSVSPHLRVGENVAELYAEHTGQKRGMPIAGIAVNSSTAEKYPEIIAWIARETMKQAKLLAKTPHQGVDSLPQEFQHPMSKKLIAASLQREWLDAATPMLSERRLKHICIAFG